MISNKKGNVMAKKLKRYYGIDRGSFGDIIHNSETGEFFSKLSVGALGKVDITLTKREDDCYDVQKVYYSQNEKKSFSLGRTFPVKNRENKIVEGLTQFGLALFSNYDSTKESEIMCSNDCLVLVTHKLKQQVKINQTLTKVGYITGKFAVEIDENKSQKADETDEIPF